MHNQMSTMDIISMWTIALTLLIIILIEILVEGRLLVK